MRVRGTVAAGLGLIVAVFSQCTVAQSTSADREAKDLFTELISFRTSEGHGQVPAMAASIVKHLTDAGLSAADIVQLPQGETTALIARLPGSDRKARPILFSAHMDVVDARPEDWERNPYRLIEDGGFYFGRGATDNKAGVAGLVMAITRLRREHLVPRRTLLFAFVGDEETAMKTTEAIAAHPWVRNAEFAINTDAGNGILGEDGKPLIYQIQGAEKTYATFEIVASNPGGHSSKPRADNAIFDLARAIERLRSLQFPSQSNGITRAYLAAAGRTTDGSLGEALRRFAANPEDEAAARVLAADPEYVGTTRTTCVPTRLAAGHADNALPQRAAVTVNCRIFPGMSKTEVQRALADAVADPRLTVRLVEGDAEAPVSEMRSDVAAAVAHWIGRHYPGVPVVPYMESGATDGRVYRAAGIPTYATSGIFRKNSDNFEHGLNERIPVRSFYESLDHIYSLAVELGGAAETPIHERAATTLEVPGYPDFLAVDGDAIWLTNEGRMEKWRRHDTRPATTVEMPEPCGAMVVAFGSLWAADCKEAAVFRIDRESGRIAARIHSGLADSNGELSVASGAGSVWVLSDAKGVLSRIDPKRNAVIAKIEVAPDSFAAAYGFGAIWITNTNASAVQRIDPRTNSVTATIRTGPTPRFLAVGENGVWTLNQGDGSVTRIDPLTNEVASTIAVGVPGTGGDIDAGGGRVWVRAKSVLLSEIDPASNTVVARYGPPAGSGAVRVSKSGIWVSAHDINTLWLMPLR